MKDKKKIAYTFMIGDLFHFGHLRILKQARDVADYHICGVISDETAKKWQSPIITTYEEREAVINNLDCVDETLRQDSIDPTDNLKYIHETYPNAHIIMFQSHQKWGQMPGVEYIQHINGEIIRPDYYPRLSRNAIAKAFITELVGTHRDGSVQISNIHLGNIRTFDKRISTKADTLNNLKPVLNIAKIESLFIFTVEQWQENRDSILESIHLTFGNTKIVVRSSSANEDSLEFSNAGAFHSELNVDSGNSGQIHDAVSNVINAYIAKNDFSGTNQILIQSQTENVTVSGVVFTRNIETNTPYYMINYDDTTNRTDTVTGGLTGKKIEIFREIPIEKVPVRWRKLIEAVQEIEDLLSGLVLDIEFAITKNDDVVIFQVRPLAANSKFYSLDDNHISKNIENACSIFLNCQDCTGKRHSVYLSDMAFWNPAEIIGDRSNHLDYSLYNHLILKTNWNEGLVPLGYTKVDEGLMTFIASKAYINIHHSFLSLLPADLHENLKTKLLNFYNDILKNNPGFHDKIEFEIVHNCFVFTFDKKAEELQQNGFTSQEIDVLKSSLINLTTTVISGSEKIISSDLKDIESLYLKLNEVQEHFEKNKTWLRALTVAYRLIKDCKKLGTTQFSRVARMAFIGKSLLQSAKDIGAVDSNDYEVFMSSIPTVATDLKNSFDLLKGKKLTYDEFINRYGHLRPGTYDITKLPYSKNPDYLPITVNKGKLKQTIFKENAVQSKINSALSDRMRQQMTRVCSSFGLGVDGEEVLRFVKTAIKQREYMKFVFTRHLSVALELIAFAGQELGFAREDLSHLDYNTLMIMVKSDSCTKDEMTDIWRKIISARKEEKMINLLVSLPPLIFSVSDFMVIPTYVSKPNFITDNVLSADVIVLDSFTMKSIPNLQNKIVVLENADPGYDWIFTYPVRGLITKYGGAASHMAIRCAEFKLPAAIGCGDLYANIVKAGKILLDCKNKRIEVIA